MNDEEEEEYRGPRCPSCFMALDEDSTCRWRRCAEHGKRVPVAVMMSTTEAIQAMQAKRGATGTGGPA